MWAIKLGVEELQQFLQNHRYEEGVAKHSYEDVNILVKFLEKYDWLLNVPEESIYVQTLFEWII